MKGDTLSKLKDEASSAFNNNDYKNALSISKKIIKQYPKNDFGYVFYIKSVTNNYTKYLNEKDQKIIKKYFNILKDTTKKKEDKLYKEYINDCKEVDSLNKNHKSLVGLYVLKNYYKDNIMDINKKVSFIHSYKLNGRKIRKIYDLIDGIFYLACFIYNLFHINFFLILTSIFGVYGVINIYKFIDDNFISVRKIRNNDYKELIDTILKKRAKYEKEIVYIKEQVEFQKEQKNEIISKIPKTFFEDIEVYNIKEESMAKGIYELKNDKEQCNKLLNENTYITIDDITDEDLTVFESKSNNQKIKKNNTLYMKKVKAWNYVLMMFYVVLSVLTSITLYKNFYELNYKSFIFGVAAGVLSASIYSVTTGKNKSIIDVFNDNILSAVFKATLVYDLVYYSISKEIDLAYGFLEIPLIFLLLLVGYASVISMIKYNILLKKFRR